MFTGIQNQLINWGVGDSDCIYSMYIENFSFLEYAKAKGLKVVVDIYEAPMTYKYMMDEISQNQEYHYLNSLLTEYQTKHEIRMKYMDRVLELADYYTVPSRFVEKSLSSFKNFKSSKVLYLPYGSSISTLDYEYKPIRHRIIWVGNDPVRKGLLYCAKAITQLKVLYPDIDFRVIGSISDDIKEDPQFSNLNFVGILNSDDLKNEYRSAEAYVFPTLSEGFAGTLIEAASCGCPIITTECSGADRETFPALYVRTNNVEDIVESVKKIFDDSSFRDALSHAVYNYSAKFRPEYYAKNLIEYFDKM